MEDVTCGVKTLLRPTSLQKLLDSIFQRYPKMRVVVVDDGKEAWDGAAKYPPSLTHIKLPYDTGLGASRNAMIDAVTTKYCVYLDDDFLFTDATRLEKFYAVLEADKADLVGGRVFDKGRFRQYHGLLEQIGRTLHYRRQTRGNGTVKHNGSDIPYFAVDVVLNFFMGRTDLLQEVKWDAELKINTHTEFFLRAKDAMRIAYCPEVVLTHRPVRHREYNKLRSRKYRKRGLLKHGIERTVFHGRWG